MFKISVIIPVYNVEKYLRECLDSVINQSYKNLEIICVNDCSLDNSQEILDEYALKDDRIVLVKNEKNLGLGLARNEGLKIATGDYVHFLDSDDWLEAETYLKLIECIKKYPQVEAIQFLWDFVTLSGERNQVEITQNNIIKYVTNVKENPNLAKFWFYNTWSKLYKYDFLIKNKLQFNDYPSIEDVEFSMKALSLLKSVYILPETLVNYRYNVPNCLSSKRYSDWKFLYKSLINSYSYFKNFSLEVRQSVFELEFAAFYNFLWDSYDKRYITISEIKETIIQFNNLVLDPDFINYNWYFYYKDVVKKTILYTLLKYCFKKNFPKLYHFVLNIKKHKKFF